MRQRGRILEEHKLYYRRRLPHIQPQNATFFVTFRLANSLPKEVVIELMMEREQNERLIKSENNILKQKALLEEERRKYFGHFDEYLDKIKKSPFWLANSKIADLVAKAIKYQDGKHYVLNAFCVMPNHVHLMIEDCKIPLYRIMQRLKSYTAIKANYILHRSGVFWHHESYDHVVNDGSEYENILWYILQNPVKAGLCNTWEDWKWSYVKPEYTSIVKQ